MLILKADPAADCTGQVATNYLLISAVEGVCLNHSREGEMNKKTKQPEQCWTTMGGTKICVETQVATERSTTTNQSSDACCPMKHPQAD